MDRDTFTARFHRASAQARDFARGFVVEPLPDALRFRVRLNSSYDGNPLVGDEVVYPEDGGFERALALHDVGADEVLAVLWRDGRVPEWVNLGVIGELGAATLIEVLACGRFSALKDHLYHEHEGYAPFHVVGPSLPVEYEEGDRFSIHDRSECWTQIELDHVAGDADRVWSLKLLGPAFGDDGLAALPGFPCLEILELRHAPLAGPGLAGLVRLPRLRVLQIHLAAADRLDLAALPSLPALEVLELAEHPAEVAGVERLVALGGLSELSLRAAGSCAIDGPLPVLPRMRRFSLQAPVLPANLIARAEELQDLGIHVDAATDADVKRMMVGHDGLEALDLHGTPVTDAFLDELQRLPRLRYLDVGDTRITTDALRAFAQRRPGLKIRPKLR
jgi:hypothetical protein